MTTIELDLEFTPPAGVWVGQLATNFHQFTFHVATRKTCARCRFTSIDGDPGGQHALSVDIDFDMVQNKIRINITLSHYLRYYFGRRASQDKKAMSRESHCRVPPSEARRMVIGGMPPRLVVTPETRKDATVPIPGHTNRDISFRYENETGNERSAIYRWIGGIYLSNQHPRVYWDDGEFHDELIKVYDGQQPFSAGSPARAGLFGTIIGGLEPPTAGKRVPFPWDEAPCLLFYERVDNTPGTDQLNAIQSIAEKLKEAVAVDLTAELEIGGKSLQDLLPMVHNLKLIQTNDYVKKITLLEQRKSYTKAARDAQEADILREKEEARQVVMKELEIERNTPSIPPPPLKYSRSRLPQRTSTSLLHTLRGVDLDSRDRGGHTSLSWATYNGHEAVVKLLLERGIDPDS
ncbi:MAG: hypothetical protein M1813_005095 [Trichoglossum hirsutum]|nr:MAG: hypothetical protein M1813_005095 [Trichoglossum hirsutum]